VWSPTPYTPVNVDLHPSPLGPWASAWGTAWGTEGERVGVQVHMGYRGGGGVRTKSTKETKSTLHP